MQRIATDEQGTLKMLASTSKLSHTHFIRDVWLCGTHLLMIDAFNARDGYKGQFPLRNDV